MGQQDEDVGYVPDARECKDHLEVSRTAIIGQTSPRNRESWCAESFSAFLHKAEHMLDVNKKLYVRRYICFSELTVCDVRYGGRGKNAFDALLR